MEGLHNARNVSELLKVLKKEVEEITDLYNQGRKFNANELMVLDVANIKFDQLLHGKIEA